MQKKTISKMAGHKDEYQLQREAYQRFIESIQGHDSRTKVEEWITYIAKNIDTYSDQEALVYLRSRGHECKEEVEKLVSNWRKAARQSIERCSKGVVVEDLGKGKKKRRGGMPLANASDVKNVSPYLLHDFWGGRDEQELSIDATMLRTVEWCDIAGFDEWWERLARITAQDVILGGIDPALGIFWLFGLSRSNYAIKLMGRALDRALEAIELMPQHHQTYPWRILRESIIKGKQTNYLVDHLPYASALVFANYRLRHTNCNYGLIKEAVQTILKFQNENGSWCCWADGEQPSIEASAMCIHALAIAQPHGWEMVASRAAAWLLSSQDPSGYWVDLGAPDQVYLSVLVLDALNLAESKKEVTFAKADPKRNQDIADTKHRFKVALSFPGELRTLVEPIANILGQELGRERVFYDRFHEAELARLNLDTYLQHIYHDKSDKIVVFLCSEYEKKEWCGMEWRAIRDLIKKRRDEDVMFFRTDTSNVSGIFSIDGSIDAMGRSSNQLASLIMSRLLEVGE